MKFSTKWYYIKETFTSLKRNSLMSIASISTVALSILVLGIFLTMVLNVNNLASHLENQVQVTIYMDDSASAEQLKHMEKVLRSTAGIVKVTPRTKEEALAEFRKRLGEQQKLLAALGEDNPFPASFEIQVDNPERIPQLVAQFQQMPGVETAKFGQEVVEHLFQLTRVLRIGGILLIVLLAIATLFIISNTIRITVFARRREVNIMKYVGATDWFIRWPFLLEGMLMGFAGAVIASLILVQGYNAIQAKIYGTLAFFPMLPSWPTMGYLSAGLICVGTLIGALGSSISLRKFLDV
ncbi:MULTISPECIES: permease-like cell division protein FtsX [Acidaminococcus]|jgi:cell division transport system permease protein|uniref:permease-like cell division protein FtsX n=1 Tax=Acidaminococcus TaxID=904 RepID=UPI00094F03A9|nr:permease-like cell division protein FtsX [Acidaminococcus massiliensis]